MSSFHSIHTQKHIQPNEFLRRVLITFPFNFYTSDRQFSNQTSYEFKAVNCFSYQL